jgi:hypothetical protein
MEIDTAVRHKAPVLFVVANNGAWQIEVHDQTVTHGKVVGTRLQHSDYAAMGRAFGLHAERVETEDQLKPAIDRALAHRPALLDVIVTSEAVSSDGKSGLAWVPDLQPLAAWRYNAQVANSWRIDSHRAAGGPVDRRDDRDGTVVVHVPQCLKRVVRALATGAGNTAQQHDARLVGNVGNRLDDLGRRPFGEQAQQRWPRLAPACTPQRAGGCGRNFMVKIVKQIDQHGNGRGLRPVRTARRIGPDAWLGMPQEVEHNRIRQATPKAGCRVQSRGDPGLLDDVIGDDPSYCFRRARPADGGERLHSGALLRYRVL